MKKYHLIYAACLFIGLGSCAATTSKKVKKVKPDVWTNYNVGTIIASSQMQNLISKIRLEMY